MPETAEQDTNFQATTVRLSPAAKRAWKTLAALEGRTGSQFVEGLILDEYARRKLPPLGDIQASSAA